MIPPIDEEILKNNPDFERVYKKVTGALLNPDGTTRDDATAKKREAVREELKEHRLRATRRYILLQAIKTAIPSSSPESTSTTTTQTTTSAAASSRPQLPNRRTRSSSSFSNTTTTTSSQQQQQTSTTPLPPELLDILYLLPPLLREAPTLPSPSLALLLTTPPLSHLPAHFPHLLAHLSWHLTSTATTLARILHPSTNSSYIHRTIASLPATTTTLLQNLATAQNNTLSTTTTTTRLRATASLKTALDKNTNAVARLLRLLETKHGPAARSTALRAEMAALDARTWSSAAQALRWDATASWYPARAREALAAYQRHLGGARMRIADAIRVREAELREFGVVVVVNNRRGDGEGDEEEVGGKGGGNMSQKEKTLREMARVYREMEGKMGEVRADLERLGMNS